ncbi:hypothetical protein FP507_10890 (plasmid) [Chlorobium phaeovibrioides]|uniref:Uncharacterized protein n=1 Tax=Chlorobium phaeovibrioides TaxID=1094 RepID=A0A5M8I8E1_CHLPH|nr:hypothetical protein [Chlorobium phaeovibrioides]KAA6230515.1 hypothetical protein FP507_10890 [Chlorobium phaeovibrioides]
MYLEYNDNQVNELKIIENNFKQERNFKELIPFIDKKIKRYDCIAIREKYIPLKAYCLARLGLLAEAEEVLAQLKDIWYGLNEDEAYRAITLVSFFISNNGCKLNSLQINTMKNWLQDPDASKQVINIIFDYKDFVGDIKPFDHSRLNIKQTKFSESLIECIFGSMQRDEETKIYYNKESNNVQLMTEGYLSNLITANHSYENQLLSDKIRGSAEQDNVIKGLHYLVPRLLLKNFLDIFKENASGYEALLSFIPLCEDKIMNAYSGYIKCIDDLVFSEVVAEDVYKVLGNWQESKRVDVDIIKSVLKKTKNQIAINYLEEVNLY